MSGIHHVKVVDLGRGRGAGGDVKRGRGERIVEGDTEGVREEVV